MNASKILVPNRIVRGFRTHDEAARPGLAHATRDGFGVIDEMGTQRGAYLGGSFVTHDGRTVDSTGAFLVGELERLDQTLHMPLAAVTWSRDIDLRSDVTFADENSSFTISTFGASGSTGQGSGIRRGKAWVAKETNQVPGVSVDIAKTVNGLYLWAREVKYTIAELESAARVGRPVDAQQFEALKLAHQMDIDEQVYVGDLTLGVGGMLNSALVTNVSNVPNGAAASTLWANKTPDEILKDVNDLLTSTWAASGWAVIPNKILLPPAQFGLISQKIISVAAGNISVLKYLQENNILTASGQGRLEFAPCKWCIGAGVGGTLGTVGNDRMMCYTKKEDFLRYPMTSLQHTPVQFQSMWQMATYYCRLGVVEIVYPETVGYRDLI